MSRDVVVMVASLVVAIFLIWFLFHVLFGIV